MIPVVVSYDIATNRVFRAPAVTAVAVFAVVQPHRLTVNHLDVVYRADSGAGSAARAILVGLEAGVRQRYKLTERFSGAIRELPISTHEYWFFECTQGR